MSTRKKINTNSGLENSGSLRAYLSVKCIYICAALLTKAGTIGIVLCVFKCGLCGHVACLASEVCLTVDDENLHAETWL